MKNFTARVKMQDGSIQLEKMDADDILTVETAVLARMYAEGKRPASVEMVYETPPMKDPMFIVQGGQSVFTLVDRAIWNGTEYVTAIYGQTLAVLREREENIYDGVDEAGNTKFKRGKPYANAVVMEWDDAWPLYEAAQAAKYIGPVLRISEERFMYLLEVLPPEDWQRGNSSESFKLMERLTGNITTIAARIGKDYYEFNDNARMSHVEIIEKITKSIEAGTVEDRTKGEDTTA